jgi:HlyD family secretion protein
LPRRILPYAGAILLAGLIVLGLLPRPIPVETAVVASGPLRVTVNEEGKTRIKERYVVSAPVAGQLRRIPFKAGAEVKGRETVVAVIDSVAPALLDARARSLAEAKRDASAASLQKARAAHNFAKSELRRFQKLYAENTISVQELEGAQLKEEAAARDMAFAESGLRQAEAELAQWTSSAAGDTQAPSPPTEVRAPTSGRVLRVFEENSRVVSAGTPLLEIGNPADLEVVVEVLSRDAAVMKPGDHVELEQWGGTEPLQAQVHLVEPTAFLKVSALGVEEQRVKVVADLLTPLDRRQGVGDNFRVEARIIVWEEPNTLKAPVGALFRRGEDWAAFVVVDGRARLRSVKAGRSSGTESQILDGLKPGESVILYPGSRVRDGQAVSIIKI